MAWFLRILFVFVVLNLDCTEYMNLELSAKVTPSGSNILTCLYRGARKVMHVGWYIGSRDSVPLTLKVDGFDAKCVVHSNKTYAFVGYLINYTCDASINNFTLEVKPETPRDDKVVIICAILEPFLDGEASTTIYLNGSETTISPSTPESTTSSPTLPDSLKITVAIIAVLIGLLFICLIGTCVVRCLKICKGYRAKNTSSSGALSSRDVVIRMEERGVKNDDEQRPPALHTGTQNKVESKTTSKQTNNRPQPLLPVDTGLEDAPKIRPQPQPPQNSDIKDQTRRGISATIGDAPGLPTETPRPSRLPPLTPKQPTVEEENASEEKTKKKRKKKKKKVQMNNGSPEEEMVELKSTRTLPRDQI